MNITDIFGMPYWLGSLLFVLKVEIKFYNNLPLQRWTSLGRLFR